jgi:NAD(P)H-dependent flavin oxidoreductase YrpB (nitropropane dioxygenase family)
LDLLKSQVAQIQRELDRPFCVNLVLAFDQRERLEHLCEAKVPVISFSWGVEAAAIDRAHQAGASVVVQVGDVQTGTRAAAAGADVLVVQGIEAGGHVESKRELLDLVRDLRARVSIPLLAAGGLAGPASVLEAREAGASGVAVGTRYLAAVEADVHPEYHRALVAARAEDTLLTGLFDVGWPNAPHRVLRNETVETWERAGSPPPGRRPGEDDTVASIGSYSVVRYSDAQPTLNTSGDISAMALYAGSGVDEVRGSEDAGEITEQLLAAFPD